MDDGYVEAREWELMGYHGEATQDGPKVEVGGVSGLGTCASWNSGWYCSKGGEIRRLSIGRYGWNRPDGVGVDVGKLGLRFGRKGGNGWNRPAVESREAVFGT